MINYVTGLCNKGVVYNLLECILLITRTLVSALSTGYGIATQQKISDLTNVDNSAPKLPCSPSYTIHNSSIWLSINRRLRCSIYKFKMGNLRRRPPNNKVVSGGMWKKIEENHFWLFYSQQLLKKPKSKGWNIKCV